MNRRKYDTRPESVCNSTLVDLLRFRALQEPNQTAYTFLLAEEKAEASLTYLQVDKHARLIAASIQRLGITAGPVLLIYSPGLDFITSLFGCLYAGMVPISSWAYSRQNLLRTVSRLQAINLDAQPRMILATESTITWMRPRLEQIPELKVLSWLATDNIKDLTESDWREPSVMSNSLALLQYTSASSSAPKGVMLTHENLLEQMRMMDVSFKHTSEDKYLSWLPTYNHMGLMAGVLEPLYAGVPAILMSPIAFLRNPLGWLQAISNHKATISGSPNFAYDLCVRKANAEEREKLDLSSWRLAFNSAEPVREETLNRFRSLFESQGFRGEAFFSSYGLAEATAMVSGGSRTKLPKVRVFDSEALQINRVLAVLPDDENSKVLVSAGKSLLNERVIIVNLESLSESLLGEIGEIWISGPNVAKGYWNRPMETERVFNGYLSSTGEGPFLRSGDLGFFHERELYIVGTLKDVINIHGLNYQPHDIEQTVEQCHSAFRPGCGSAFTVEISGEQLLVIIQEVVTHQQLDLNALIRSIHNAVHLVYELEVEAVVLIKPGSIFKTSSGKIQRHACRAGFLGDRLDTVAEWRAVGRVWSEPKKKR